MDILTEREKLLTVLPRWESQYPPGSGHEETTAKLRALDFQSCTRAEVEAIIGNSSWTNEMCCNCSRYAIPVIVLGRDDTSYICRTCVAKAEALTAVFDRVK